MAAIDEILDWMRANADDFEPPDPASPDEIAVLQAEGVPSELIALYRVVGSDLPGLLPATSDSMSLRFAANVRRTADGAGWVFADSPSEQLILGARGVECSGAQLCPDLEGRLSGGDEEGGALLAASLDALLAQRLAELIAGSAAWDHEYQAIVSADALPDSRLLVDVAARVTGHPDALARWTEALVEDLVALTGSGSSTVVPFPPIGTMTVTTRRAFTGHDPDTGEDVHVPARFIPVLRIGRWMKWGLNADGPEPPPEAAVRIRGLPLTPEVGHTLGAALAQAVADALLQGRRIHWPGFGALAMSRCRAFADPMHTTERRILVFRAFAELKDALNRDLSSTAPAPTS